MLTLTVWDSCTTRGADWPLEKAEKPRNEVPRRYHAARAGAGWMRDVGVSDDPGGEVGTNA